MVSVVLQLAEQSNFCFRQCIAVLVKFATSILIDSSDVLSIIISIGIKCLLNDVNSLLKVAYTTFFVKYFNRSHIS